MYVISHRGNTKTTDENSIEAIRAALGLAVDEIEFDVHESADHHLLLHHDPLFEEHEISKSKASTLQLPPLDEALSLFKNKQTIARIEIKSADIKTVSALLERHKGIAIKIISFNYPLLREIHKKHPAVPLSPLQKKHPFGIVWKAKKLGATEVTVNQRWLFILPVYYYLFLSGLRVVAYTVNSYSQASLITFCYPNAAITTDNAEFFLTRRGIVRNRT